MLNKLFKTLATPSTNTKKETKTKTKKWICDFCGEENFDYDFDCQNCGHERED